MSESAVSKIAAPQMRGLLQKNIKANIAIALVLSVAAGVATKVLVNDRRKQRYADFYKNYDADQDFERMRKLGLFNSCDDN